MFIAGIDIGGTSIKAMIVDEQKNEHFSFSLPTAAQDGKNAILKNLFLCIETCLKKYSIQGIGIGTAGRVNVRTGEIVYATDNLPGWEGTKLKELVEGKFGLPAAIENDANAALIGEMWTGAAQNFQDTVMLTLGTGVGGAQAVCGRIHHGTGWSGGEWGHSILYPGGKPCNCGLRGCIEQYLSGRALLNRANTESIAIFRNGSEVFEEFEKGNPEIIKVVGGYLDDLVTLLTTLRNGMDPEVILIGGGVIDSKKMWWPLLESKLAALPFRLNIKSAELGNNAGCVGAGKMMLDILRGQAVSKML
ncbi:ROK family protein [Metabacillus sp. cB07]|uniref:ROK family protein n=1 Tax=Metabacillus sp. cB07 TaxID=2806989 RepID=UPI001939B240|nr:ROK family protein [Metabacillus sp. cB07]